MILKIKRGPIGVGTEMCEPTEDMELYILSMDNGKDVELGVDASTVGPQGLSEGIFDTRTLDDEFYEVQRLIKEGVQPKLAGQIVGDFSSFLADMQKAGKVKKA